MSTKLTYWMVLGFAVSSMTVSSMSYAGEGHAHHESERNTLMSSGSHEDHSDYSGDDDHADHGEHSNHDEERHSDKDHEDHSDHGGHDDHADHGEHSNHDEENHGDKSHEDHSDHGGNSGHDEHGHEEESSVAELSAEQRAMAGIEILMVTKQSLGQAITAPGEATLNAYQTTKITPRTSAQVVARHVRLGDHVDKGQPLVKLSSMEMAQAQGELIQANAELRRVKKLGQKVVSGKRFVTAQIAYQLAYAKVNAYGMTQKQIKSFLRKNDATQATGEFDLLSFQSGTVMSDDFVVGEFIEPGQVLMTISDESVLWIEARLTPDDAARIQLGAPVRILVGDVWMSGKVVQARHALDKTTRTLSVNIEVANERDTIHPGQFVQVVIEDSVKQHGIVLPVEAVVRSADGHWQVFVEVSEGRFEPKEVTVLQTVGDLMLIEGIPEYTTVVSKGAFFVQSEIAKGGFDPHNH